MDGSTIGKGSGVGILLVSSQRDVIQVAMQLSFKVSNNEVEYETLLVGLQATKYIGVVMVVIHSNSQLVACQLKGMYEVKNDRLCKYATKDED